MSQGGNNAKKSAHKICAQKIQFSNQEPSKHEKSLTVFMARLFARWVANPSRSGCGNFGGASKKIDKSTNHQTKKFLILGLNNKQLGSHSN